MKDIFIQEIKVVKARNLVDFNIRLSSDERKHLLITGKNGSGKTSLLVELRNFLRYAIEHANWDAFDMEMLRLDVAQLEKDNVVLNESSPQEKIAPLDERIQTIQDRLKRFGGTIIRFANSSSTRDYFQNGNFIVVYFDAKRNVALKTPTGINKVNLRSIFAIDENACVDFIQYIVNLKADRSFANDDNDTVTVKKIDQWFEQFEQNLFKLFDTQGIQLQFDRTNYNFNIIEEGKAPYNFNQLSAGYSAIFNIISELIMRMEKTHIKSYDVQGVVLIDEIETHLHIDLQKKILPFLTAFFPKIQFIVTTHSPFVLSSVENAVICDLEKRIVTTDLSGYSYDTLVESYFDSDKYSSILKERINEYEELLEKDVMTEDEKDRLFELKRYINDIPKFASDEVAVKIQQLRLKELNKRVKNGLPA